MRNFTQTYAYAKHAVVEITRLKTRSSAVQSMTCNMRKIPKPVPMVYPGLSGSAGLLILNVMFLLSYVGKDYKLAKNE